MEGIHSQGNVSLLCKFAKFFLARYLRPTDLLRSISKMRVFVIRHTNFSTMSLKVKENFAIFSDDRALDA